MRTCGRFFINVMELELTLYLYHDNISFRIIIGRQRMMFFINGISIKRIWFWTIILKSSMVMICKKYKYVIIFLLFIMLFFVRFSCLYELQESQETKKIKTWKVKKYIYLCIYSLLNSWNKMSQIKTYLLR